MSSHSLEVDILVNSKPIKKYAHQNKVFVVSPKNVEYSIRIKNNSWNRKLVVIAVDGINVVDGLAAGASKVGYVINGYSSSVITGFRTSLQDIHPFKFNYKEKSYAAKSDETKGDTSNCGVIGVESYWEKIEEVPLYTLISSHLGLDTTLCGSCSSSAVASSNPQYQSDITTYGQASCSSLNNDIVYPDNVRCCNFDMGTEFSKRVVNSPVKEVLFETGNLDETIVLYYASYHSLEEMGIPLTKEVHVSFPNPFPARFCKPPR